MNPVVGQDKWRQLEQRMRQLGVSAADLEESFIRAGGPGGQKVNKSAACVLLRHRPSGLQVKCQTSRYQAVNRLLARRRLLDKIERQQRGVVAAEQQRVAKIRRQKRRRSRRARQKMLEDKARQSAKKQARRRPLRDED